MENEVSLARKHIKKISKKKLAKIESFAKKNDRSK